jgi:hypothetical protein
MSRKPQTRIRRSEHNASNNYFMVARTTAQHAALSYEALGLLTSLLSHNDNWVVQPETLKGRGAGRDRVYKLLNELIALGYIERVTKRDDKQRVVSVDYYVNETPRPEKPDTAQPDTGSPDTEKPHINKYKEGISTKEKNAAIAAQAEPASKVISIDKPRDVIFDALALGSFGIAVGTKVSSETASRVGLLKKWLKNNYAGADDTTVAAFYRWYDASENGASRPRDVKKFASAFDKFHAEVDARKNGGTSNPSNFGASNWQPDFWESFDKKAGAK